MLQKMSSFGALLALSAGLFLTVPSHAAQLRVVNLSPDAPALDICVDGNLALPEVGFREVSPFQTVANGSYALKGVSHDSACDSPAITSTTVDLTGGGSRTVVALNTLSSIETLTLVDDFSTPELDSNRVRLVNAIVNSPAIDVWVVGAGSAAFEDLPFKGVISRSLGNNETYLQVRNATSETVLTTVGPFNFVEGGVYSLFLSGDFNNLSSIGAVLKKDAQFGFSKLRFINACPDVLGLTICDTIDLIGGGISFGQLTFEYDSYLPGPQRFFITEQGSEGCDPGAPVDKVLDLAAGTRTTIAAINPFASIDAIGLNDDLSSPSSEENVRVRVVNLLSDSVSVDVATVGSPVANPLWDDVAFKGQRYIEIPAEKYTFELRTAAGAPLQVFEEESFTGGDVYSLYLIGLVNGSPGMGLIVEKDAEYSFVSLRTLNASPDAASVDICLDGEQRAAAAALGDISPYADASVGPHNFKVTSAGTGCAGTPLLEADSGLAFGKDVTFVAANTAGLMEPLYFTDDNTAPAFDEARVRFVNLILNAPEVDVALAGSPADGALWNDVAFRESGGYVELSEGTVDLEMRSANGASTLLPIEDVTFEGGKVYTVWALGLLGGSPSPSVLISMDKEYAYGRLRVFNDSDVTSPDVVDLCADGQRLASNVGLRNASAYSVLTVGDVFARIVSTGDPCNESGFAATNVPILAGSDTTYTLSGGIYADDNSQPAPGSARVRVLNLIQTTYTADVGTAASVETAPLWRVSARKASEYVTLPACDYNFSYRDALGESPRPLVSTTLQAGGVYTLYILSRFDQGHITLDAKYEDSTSPECAADGEPEGTPEGTPEGSPEGSSEGTPEGSLEGAAEGAAEGFAEGQADGEGEAIVCVIAPYPGDDPVYQQVIFEDDYCCTGEWDSLCDRRYYAIETEGELLTGDCVVAPYAPGNFAYDSAIGIDSYCCYGQWDVTCEQNYGIITYLSGDQNANAALELAELLRLIQFYNADGFSCAIENTEDGYQPDTNGDQDCLIHDSDYAPQDWSISLSELLRAVQFFNSNGYIPCEASEDGYCPDFTV